MTSSDSKKDLGASIGTHAAHSSGHRNHVRRVLQRFCLHALHCKHLNRVVCDFGYFYKLVEKNNATKLVQIRCKEWMMDHHSEN